MKTHPGSRNLTVLSLAMALVAACGDDDESSTKSKESYCAIEQQIDDSFDSAFATLGADPTAEQITTAMAGVAATVLDKFGDDAKAAAPDQIAADVALLFAATEKAAKGDLGAFDDPMTSAAGERVDEFCRT